jgi:hypothetical protein
MDVRRAAFAKASAKAFRSALTVANEAGPTAQSSLFPVAPIALT